MKTFKLDIFASDKVFFSGEVTSVVLPLSDGKYGIMANHVNMIGAVEPGVMKYTLPDGKEKFAVISGGLVKSEDGDLLVLSAAAEAPEDVGKLKDKMARDREREQKLHKQSLLEFTEAQTKIAKALLRDVKKAKNESGREM